MSESFSILEAPGGRGHSAGQRLAFFRQSGWMIVATVVGGGLQALVHTFAKEMRTAEYAVFFALLQVFLMLSMPSGGLQSVFAQLTAAAVTDEQTRRLRGATRGVLRGLFWIWLAMAVAAFVAQGMLLSLLKISHPVALWATVAVGLIVLWQPVMSGLLQGSQNFLWLGGGIILAGLGRLLAVAAIVLYLGGQAAGAMWGVFLGALACFLPCAWAARGLWRGPAAPFDFGPWLRRVVPLTLGLGAGTFLLTFDMVVVQAVFGDPGKELYAAAGMIGRALVMFTTPMALVLFPKIARSAATGEPTEVLKLALGATLATGLAAALACTVLPSLPLRILYAGKAHFLEAAPLVPWFAWCMLPLTVAYTLVNNLLARERFRAVPWLVLVAVGYGLTLVALRGRLAALEPFDGFRVVIGTLGGFSVLLLAVAAAFSWRR